jgi:hypothetical protein
MTPAQRQSAFQRFFADLARQHAERKGLSFVGTIRKLPPPPLPGEPLGVTRYFLNAVSADGRSTGLVELTGTAGAALQRAERWAETGRGAAPKIKAPRK